MGKIATYEAYFKDIATKYKPIGHLDNEPRFWVMSQAEVMSSARSKLNLNDWNLVLLQPEHSVRTNGSRQYMFWAIGGFEIVKNVVRDDISKTQVQDIALNYCREIVAKMMNEHKERTFGLGFLEETSLDFYLIDQQFDKAVGCGVSFQFHEGFSRTDIYNEANWNA